jgi:hypothetical protein
MTEDVHHRFRTRVVAPEYDVTAVKELPEDESISTALEFAIAEWGTKA